MNAPPRLISVPAAIVSNVTAAFFGCLILPALAKAYAGAGVGLPHFTRWWFEHRWFSVGLALAAGVIGAALMSLPARDLRRGPLIAIEWLLALVGLVSTACALIAMGLPIALGGIAGAY